MTTSASTASPPFPGDVGDTPLEDYGLVGDTRTAALVSSGGSIDWMCTPRFDGSPIFARLVGGASAGRFAVAPSGPAVLSLRRYVPDTATIETVWDVGPARLRLRDAMLAELSGGLLPSTVLVRRVEALGGPVEVTVTFDPRWGRQRRRPRTRRDGTVLVCQWGASAISLTSSPAVPVEAGAPVPVTVEPDRPLTIVLAVAHREPLIHVEPTLASRLIEADEQRWRNWASEVEWHDPWRTEIVRSLITLRLLTYSPSGAPVAAPTTSLPEDPGGVRNWDYRFAWPRDASIGVSAFTALGKPDEARAFLAWLLHASRLARPRLPALLTIDGCRSVPERTLAGWPGYRSSTPVRIGNGASEQHQLDGYGWVIDAAWTWVEAGGHLDGETWRALRAFAGLVARRWSEPDAGIWEVRDEPAQHVHSKLMAWLALDRALRISDTHRTRDRQRRRWSVARDALGTEVRARGFDSELGSYVRHYGSTDLDAALLVLPLVGLEPPGSPRTIGTIDAVRRALGAGGPLLYRYPPGRDGLEGTEGAFLPCSFWLVQALAATGRVDEAAGLFEDLLGLASPLGLYGEEMDPSGRTHLGNYPQALTSASLLQAALSLRTAGGDQTSRP